MPKKLSNKLMHSIAWPKTASTKKNYQDDVSLSVKEQKTEDSTIED